MHKAFDSVKQAVTPAAADSGAAPSTTKSVAVQPMLWESITGGYGGSDFAGRAFTKLRRPVAVAAVEDTVYIVDADWDAVFTYDRVSGQLSVLKDLRGMVTGDVADIYVARDRSFYIADTQGSRVLYFNRAGDLLQTYSNTMNLARPVAISVDEARGDVYIADGVLDHVLVFTRAGQLLAGIGGRGQEPGEFLNITGMARGPEGFYIAARLGQRGQVLEPNGQYLYSLQADTIVFPMGVAVDNESRVFIGDFFDNTIKIFQGGQLIQTLGGTGVIPGHFKGISDVWVEGGLLYVADSLNGRIQVLRLSAMPKPVLAPAPEPTPQPLQ